MKIFKEIRIVKEVKKVMASDVSPVAIFLCSVEIFTLTPCQTQGIINLKKPYAVSDK